MHAASTSYSAEIKPDVRLRRVVLLSGALLFLSGLACAALLALAVGLKALVALVWACVCGYEWLAFRHGYGSGRVLRIAAGGPRRVRADNVNFVRRQTGALECHFNALRLSLWIG